MSCDLCACTDMRATKHIWSMSLDAVFNKHLIKLKWGREGVDTLTKWIKLFEFVKTFDMVPKRGIIELHNPLIRGSLNYPKYSKHFQIFFLKHLISFAINILNILKSCQWYTQFTTILTILNNVFLHIIITLQHMWNIMHIIKIFATYFHYWCFEMSRHSNGSFNNTVYRNGF